ncbi:HET-domain-containing protein [Melanomma pulvis-pyrius CBS 109.77]|uniref:HET-domain-containing protein n=1 Tax=Melanomma pulvis-pyrius CBS 109.77 TaxID=1314802 RepID=A0A6A6XK82_9PLEO|nr:HET-domain-containing protein [Melanomma pulvis-pyrius CBS 109.77]
MRLLQLQDDGTFSLTSYVGKYIPPYAILSHTWGADHEEITFEDIAKGTGNSTKIQFCGKQAIKDGLQHFWVDTCCIDKSSSAELSEAINSMFRWYQNATRCYVYLSDVSVDASYQYTPSSPLPCELAFRQSRWFTRGWTLQETIASSSLQFFSREGILLGDKTSLEHYIHEITGIAIQALQGTPLSDFSIAERISWAANRETTIEEDQVYCLLGIFDVHMPLIYGEGMEHAFRRLRKEIPELGRKIKETNFYA